jgi:PAS domain S-box-containing protein
MKAKSIDDMVKSTEVLFNKNTAIVHMSGNKETVGKILKTNQGINTVFGYNKNEVVGHQINILMPKVYSKKHNLLLDRYFRTGHQTMFF